MGLYVSICGGHMYMNEKAREWQAVTSSMATLAFFKKGFLTYLQLTDSQTICLVSEAQDPPVFVPALRLQACHHAWTFTRC